MTGRADDASWEAEWLLRIGAVAPAYWGAVIEMQLRRLDEGAKAHRRRATHPYRLGAFDGFGASMTHDFGPMQADAYLLMMAVRHLLALSDRYADRFDDSRAKDAQARFDAEAPDAKALRDVLAHIDAYAVGEGRRSDYEATGQWFIQLGIDDARNEYDLRAGRLHVELRRTAAAAAELARSLNEIATGTDTTR